MSVKDLLHRPESHFIAGCWRSSDLAPIEVVDPSTGGVFAEIPPATAADVEAAARAAAEAFPAWARTPSWKRIEYLLAFSKGLAARREALIELQMLNNGKPRSEA